MEGSESTDAHVVAINESSVDVPASMSNAETAEQTSPRGRAPSPQRRFGDIAGVIRDQPLVQLVAGDDADPSEPTAAEAASPSPSDNPPGFGRTLQLAQAAQVPSPSAPALGHHDIGSVDSGNSGPDTLTANDVAQKLNEFTGHTDKSFDILGKEFERVFPQYH